MKFEKAALLQIRTTPQNKDEIVKEAEKRGQTISTFVLRAVDKELNG